MWSLLMILARLFLAPLVTTVFLGLLLAPAVFLPLSNGDEFLVEVQRDKLIERFSQVVSLKGRITKINRKHMEITPDPSGITGCAFDRVSRAIVATEIYNRPIWLSKLEFLFYDAVVAIGLPPPNLTLGVGQIAVPRAKEALQWSVQQINQEFATKISVPTDREIVYLLRMPCSNIRLVFLIVRLLIERDRGQRAGQFDIGSIATLYRGGKHRFMHGIAYEDVVDRLSQSRWDDVDLFSTSFSRGKFEIGNARQRILGGLGPLPLSGSDLLRPSLSKVLACGFVAGNTKIFANNTEVTDVIRCIQNATQIRSSDHKGEELKIYVSKVSELNATDKVLLLSELFVAKEMMDILGIDHLTAEAKVVEGRANSWKTFEDVGLECHLESAKRESIQIVTSCH